MQKSIIRLTLVTGALLLIPLVAMQFTSEVNWTLLDFTFAGTLIFGTGFLFEHARKKASGNSAYKFAAACALAGIFFLIWINGAVGIIGDSDVNVLYGVVPMTLIIGATIARLESQGMSRALFATALAQALVPVIALFIWNPQPTDWAPGVPQVFMLNAFFVMLFGVSGLLFRHASATGSKRQGAS